LIWLKKNYFFYLKVGCLTQECERLGNKPNQLVDEISSGNSSLSSSPSIISFSDKSNDADTSNESSKFDRSAATINSVEPSLNRSKSLIDRNSISTTRLRHVKKRSFTSNDPVFKDIILDNEIINRSNKTIHHNSQFNSSSINHKHYESHHLCPKCNCEQNINSNSNVNKSKKSKSKYFIDTDIFLKFFFIM